VGIVAEKFRLPEEMRTGPRKAGRGRPPRRRSRPFRQGLVLGVCLGMTAALLVGVLGFLVTRPTATAPAAAPATTAKVDDRRTPPQAAIAVTSEHLGDLQVQIQAQVTAPETYDPITKGQVVAYTDMVAMPKMHRQGPIMMAEVSGRPGVYQALTTVPMIGEYHVTVEVKQPMASQANQRIDVQTVKK
jgi:YtkA-like protein